MSDRLVKMAASIQDTPTLEQVDAMLSELAILDRSDQATQKVENGLLDMRSLLTSLARAEAHGPGAADDEAPGPRRPEPDPAAGRSVSSG